MESLLTLARDAPRRSLAPDETLVADGAAPGTLFVLLGGTLRVEKDGVPVAYISDAGACVGEISLLLDIPATADVVAVDDAVVAVVTDAARVVDARADVARDLACLLAVRLQRMTTYLADLRRQYADHEGGLGMIDAVLGSLMHRSGERSTLVSERDPHPEY